jgi:hypothetical protein
MKPNPFESLNHFTVPSGIEKTSLLNVCPKVASPEKKTAELKVFAVSSVTQAFGTSNSDYHFFLLLVKI